MLTDLIAQIESATARMTIPVREQMDVGNYRAAQLIIALQTRITDAIRAYGMESEHNRLSGPERGSSAS